MKRILVLAFFTVIVFSSVCASMVQKNKKIVGEWKYESPSAPAGYDKGMLIISKKKKNLKGELRSSDGVKVEFEEVTFNKGVFKCTFYVSGEMITITATVDGKTMTGVVNTPGGDISLHAGKV